MMARMNVQSSTVLLVLITLAFGVVVESDVVRNNWVELDPNIGLPSSRFQQSMVHSASTDLVFMFFGFDTTTFTYINDSWIFDRERDWWYKFTPHSSAAPSARAGYSLVSYFNHNQSTSQSKRDSPPPQNSEKLLMFGGLGRTFARDYLWELDVSTFEWQLIDSAPALGNFSKPVESAFQSMTTVGDSLYVFGGENNECIITKFWSYNITSGYWRLVTNSTIRRSRHSAVYWNGKLFFFGGCTDIAFNVGSRCNVTNSVLIYDLEANDWVTYNVTQPIPVARQGHVGVLLETGYMAVYGGYDQYNELLSDTWLFNLDTYRWSQVQPKGTSPSGSYQASSTVVDATTVLIFGGAKSLEAPKSPSFIKWDIINENRSTWDTIASPMITANSQVQMVATNDSLYAMNIATGYFVKYNIQEDCWQNLTKASLYHPFDSDSDYFYGMNIVTINKTVLTAFQYSGNGTINNYIYDFEEDKWSIQEICRQHPLLVYGTSFTYNDTTVIIVRGKEIVIINLQTNSCYFKNIYTFTRPGGVTYVNGYFYSFIPQSTIFYKLGPVDDNFNLTVTLHNFTSNYQVPAISNPIARKNAGIIPMGNKILFFGGVDITGFVYNDLWEYNTILDQFTLMATTNNPNSRYLAATTAIGSTIYIYGGTTGFRWFYDFYTLNAGCNAGSFSPDYSNLSCELCPIGTFSGVGQVSCTPCPANTTTPQMGSPLHWNCSSCAPDYCHYHEDSCAVDLSKWPEVKAYCACKFGYWPSPEARCGFPLIWVLIAIAACFIGVFMYSVFTRYRHLLAKSYEKIMSQDDEIKQLKGLWQIDPAHIVWESRISSGTFGEVWKCTWNDSVVATKKLFKHWIDFDPNTAIQFEHEIELLQSMRHPNIVLFFGAGKLDDGIPFLVTEFVPRGSLTSLLKKEGSSLSWKEKISFMLGAANGMMYLHSSIPYKIHRDFKPQNLLVTANRRIKIADFGTAKLVFAQSKWEKTYSHDKHFNAEELLSTGTDYSSENQIGTLPYMAPELHGSAKITNDRALDVYSFGMTMWVVGMATGEDPFAELQYSFMIRSHVVEGARPQYGQDWHTEYVALMVRCWDGNPDARPMFSEIVEELCRIGELELSMVDTTDIIVI